MATATLKPPPKFVTNEWAWAYTLNKLAEKDGLNDGGNPRNYAAAVAIYKRVDAKYGNPDATPAAVVADAPALIRADLIALQSRRWVVARGFAYTTAADHAVRVFTSAGAWRIERIFDDGRVRTDPIASDTVSWLFEHDEALHSWALTA